MTDITSNTLTTDQSESPDDDWLGWTFTETEAIFSPAVGFAKEWDAMHEPFVVVNIKTAGPDPESCEIVEIAVLLVDPTGTVTSEFTQLVKVANPVPDDVLKLIGITQEQLAREGQPLVQVMKDYLAFVASRPVFFKNAFVDLPLLKKAAVQTWQTINESVYDIDFIALMTWPQVQVMGFDAVATHVGAPKVRPRCIDDTKAALVILLAGREAAFVEESIIFDPVTEFPNSWAAMRETFAVVGIETTGPYPKSDEILEFAALLVEPSGAITSEFSALVKVEQPLKQEIIELVEITQAMVELEGIPLPEAMAKFLAFVGNRPVFFHHSIFDHPFLESAEEKTGQIFSNKMLDTFAIFKMVWTDWAPYSVKNLTKHLGLCDPQPRAIGYAKATLAILLAAREAAFGQSWG